MTPETSPAAPERVPCPACAEPVLPEARKCRWCGEWFAELWLAPKARGGEEPARLADLDDPFAKSDQPRGGQDIDPEIDPKVLEVPAILLEVGAELAKLADPERDGSLLERLREVRRRIALEYGVIAPGVNVRPNPRLEPGGYQIRIRGDLVAEDVVHMGRVLGMGADIEPPGDVVATHVHEITTRHLAEVLTREEVAELLRVARTDHPMVVQELVPNLMSLGQVRQVLQNLVREQVPIKDLSTILNALADNAVYTKDPHALTEHVRQALGRRICSRNQSPDGVLRAFMLSPDAERSIQNAIQLNETGQVLMLDPNTSRALQANLADALAKHRDEVLDPIIVCPPKIRRHVRSLLERDFSKIVVLSYTEVVPGVQVQSLEMIDGLSTDTAGAAGPLPSADIASSGWLLNDEDESVPPSAPAPPLDDDPNDAMSWNW